jgi:hypothetical protein
MEKNTLEDIVIVGSNRQAPDFNPESLPACELDMNAKIGKPFHQLYVWNSLESEKPRIIDIPYDGDCIFGFNDLKIKDNQIFVANSEGLIVYDLENFKLNIVDGSISPDILHLTDNKIISIHGSEIQIRDPKNISEIINKNSNFTSVEFYKNDKDADETTFSAFSLKRDGKEYAILNRGSIYMLDPEKCTLNKIIKKESRGLGWTCGVFQYGADFQVADMKNKQKIFSLNDFNESHKSCVDDCEGFKTIRTHLFDEKNKNYYLIGEKPIKFEDKIITSILLGSDNNLNILTIEDKKYELLIYDIEEDKLIDKKELNIKYQPHLNKNLLESYLINVDGDIKMIGHHCTKYRPYSMIHGIAVDEANKEIIQTGKVYTTPVDYPNVEDEIYVHSINGKHEDIRLTGAKQLCQIPAIGACRRLKYCEIAAYHKKN